MKKQGQTQVDNAQSSVHKVDALMRRANSQMDQKIAPAPMDSPLFS
jgi:hypothetical protein